ncbi:YciI family protein [Mumia sp. Pv 4-285]|uniref:YciI family protein n=1 Tax=Mumia qirimensis TaxID=3234852 RepID=UPI00351CE059
MKFLMLVRDDPDLTFPEEGSGEVRAWTDTMDANGSRLIGDRLAPPPESVVVRVREGAVVRSDGPYAETREHVGGFDVLEAPDLEAAVAIAAAHPIAAYGSLEIRPFWPLFDGS